MTGLRQRRLMGVAYLSVAVLFVFGVCTGRMEAPLFLAFAVAGVFSLAGLQLIGGFGGRLSDLMGGVVCGLFSGLGVYVALSHGPIEGGIPFFPAGWNQTLGRIMFGAGAIVTAVAAVWFIRRAVWRKSPKTQPQATREDAPES